MSSNDTIRDVRHVKAAREMLRWDQERLAREASLSIISVRRYEAAREAVADTIERDIVAALEAAGVVFVPAGQIDDMDISGGVLLRAAAVPDQPAGKRVYVYASAPPGRPAGKRDTGARKPRGPRPKPDQA